MKRRRQTWTQKEYRRGEGKVIIFHSNPYVLRTILRTLLLLLSELTSFSFSILLQDDYLYIFKIYISFFFVTSLSLLQIITVCFYSSSSPIVTHHQFSTYSLFVYLLLDIFLSVPSFSPSHPSISSFVDYSCIPFHIFPNIWIIFCYNISIPILLKFPFASYSRISSPSSQLLLLRDNIIIIFVEPTNQPDCFPKGDPNGE